MELLGAPLPCGPHLGDLLLHQAIGTLPSFPLVLSPFTHPSKFMSGFPESQARKPSKYTQGYPSTSAHFLTKFVSLLERIDHFRICMAREDQSVLCPLFFGCIYSMLACSFSFSEPSHSGGPSKRSHLVVTFFTSFFARFSFRSCTLLLLVRPVLLLTPLTVHLLTYCSR